MNNQFNPDVMKYLYVRAAQTHTPLGGTFEITPRCNFNCKMCYIRLNCEEMQSVGRERTVDEWLSLAQDATEAGMLFLLLTGGEPLVYEGFDELYRGLKKLGLMVSLNTNAALLTGDRLKRLIENPPYRVNITLYAVNNEGYERLCGCSDGFDRVENAVTQLKKAGVSVKLNVSVTENEIAVLKAMFDFAKKLDVPLDAGSYMFPDVRKGGACGENTGRLSAEQAGFLQSYIDLLRAESAGDYREFALQLLSKKPVGYKAPECFSCRAGVSSFWVTWHGEMSACGMFDCFIGKPFEEGFDKAWSRVNSGVLSANVLLGCVDCDKRHVCKVCPAMAALETGNRNGRPKYVCEMLNARLVRTKEFLRGTKG